MTKQRRTPRPNYFRLLDEHPRGEDHPIDLAVRRRGPQRVAQKRLRSLQRTVEAQLGDNKKALIDLEELWSVVRLRRDEGYFNVGFECGLAEGVARANPFTRSGKGKRLAREVRALAMQAQLPTGEVVAVLFECLGAALSAAAIPVSLKLPPGSST